MSCLLIFVVAASGLLIAQQSAPTEDVTSGASLLHDCEGAVKTMAGSYLPSDNLGGQFCFGYLEGMANGTGNQKAYCLGNFRPSTLTQVYVAFMKRNPQYLDKPKGEGVFATLVSAYPCTIRN
jgi:hypothetical protein